MSNKTILSLAAFAIVCLVALVYWPVHNAGFVWDDKILFSNAAWLRSGDDWRHFIFQNDHYDWASFYFRPLVVALYVVQVRVFDVAPGPMHLVSLAIHLLNTLLVGTLAMRIVARPGRQPRWQIFASVAMLIYGLHPALVEPVVWISCQYELVVVLFMLLGLWFNSILQDAGWRAIMVALSFFLAACAKESAATFPLLLLLLDFTNADSVVADGERWQVLRRMWRRQWAVYLSAFGAGLAYLALRHSALGSLVHAGAGESWFSLARFQTVCFTYLTYWRVIIWPMIELGPTHVVDMHQFAETSMTSIAVDIGAVSVLFLAMVAAWKRKPVGYLILGATLALIPVLHLVPVPFNSSLYHERYAMMAVAIVCALLPRAVDAFWSLPVKSKLVRPAAAILAVVWLCLAVVNVRVTVPLWSDETRLWLLALKQDPDSLEAKVHLLSTYLEQNDRPRARELAAQMMTDTHPCATCMINIANLSLADGNVAVAEEALARAKKSIHPGESPRIEQAYIVAIGQLKELKHDIPGAEETFRDAITLDPFDTQARMNLALMLARQGNEPAAIKALNEALPLLSPNERDAQRKLFEQTLSAVLSTKTIAPH